MKRIVMFLACLCLVVTCLCLLPTEANAATATGNTTEFAGGSGTADDPYLISTKEHLNNVRNYLSAHFKMINDIEFTDADFAEGGAFYNRGAGWKPIGTGINYAFTGVFDGNGFAIKNLYINIKSDYTVYAGLFGSNKGTIKNLGMVDGSVSATSTSSSYASACAGGIVGYNWAGTITNCYNTGSVSATATSSSDAEASAYAGGIAGDSFGPITDCYNTGSVSATATSSSYARAYAGGIAGSNAKGTTTNCYNTGSVSATATSSSDAWAYAGGITGRSDAFLGYEGSSIIQNCYNTGNVSASATGTSSDADASAYAGGIAGYEDSIIQNCYNTGNVSASATETSSYGDTWAYAGGITGRSDEGTITSCYNTGSVTATGASYAYAGGIAGDNHSTITDCYYANNTDKGVGNGTGSAVRCTLEKMKLQNTFVGFDFDAVWTFEETLITHPFPVLKSILRIGEGYIGIYTKEDLNAVRNDLSGKYILMNDIVFTDADFTEGGAFYNGGQGWMPIGSSYYTAFTGIFDGNGFAIKNLQIKITSDTTVYAGLFGYNKGTVKNLGMVDGSVSATLSASGDTSASVCAGGIAGINFYGTITNCYNTGSVSAHTTGRSYYDFVQAGGIAGDNSFGTITNCYNTGSVSATATSYDVSVYAGGITGDNFGAITDCYNTGNVTATADSGSIFFAYAGGIAGDNSYGTITNCYNTGSVSATATAYNVSVYAGGIAGKSYDTIRNCYYANNTDKGVGYGTDAAVKCTLEEMKLQSTFVGFDFYSVWTMTGHEDYLYPELNSVPMVFEKPLDSIEVTTKPNKLTYLDSDVFDPTGMIVTAYYSDGTSAIITDYSIDVSASALGKKTVTVSYGGKTATFTVDVVYTVIFRLEDGTVLSTKTYHYGEAVEIPEDPAAPENHAFLGWDAEVTACQGDAAYTAVFKKLYTPGDLDGVEGVTDADAVYLLYHTFLPDLYPVDQDCDFNGDGEVNDSDAVHLLYYTFLPDLYPLH